MARRRLFSKTETTLIASAVKVNIEAYEAVKRVLALRQKWQDQAWETYDAVGEVKYGVNSLAALVSRVTIFAAEMPENEKDSPPKRTSNPEVKDAVERLGSIVKRSEIIRELAIGLLVPGEVYLICFGPREAETNGAGDIIREASDETWEIRSQDEIKTENNQTKVLDITSESEKWITLDQTKGDAFIRIWRQHARKHALADSHVRGILDPAEELLWWDAAARARSKSRFSDRGIVLVPSDMDLPPRTEDDKKLTGAQRTAKEIQDVASHTLQNPGSAAASVPLTATYPANDQRRSGLEHITFESPTDDLMEKRTDRCLQRIEQGLNLPVGIISGLGEASHWGGGQIEESTFREHVEPLIMLIITALTEAYLHPLLKEAGVADYQKYVIWYDASSLIIHQDKSTNAIRALELGGINWPALRRALGFNESDAPTDEEAEEILEWLKSVRGGNRDREGIVANPQDEEIDKPDDPTAPPKKNAPGERTPVEQPSGPMRRRGQSPIAASIQVMADEQIRRAHEKAGNRLRSRAKKIPAYANAIKGVKSEDVARTLGRDACLKLGIDDIFEGCFNGLESRFIYFASEGNGVHVSRKAVLEFRTVIQELAVNSLFAKPDDDLIVPASTVNRYLTAARGDF